MAFNSLNDFVVSLEKEGELVRIDQKINPDLEITEISEREMKSHMGGKAILFENNGTEFPVLINMMGNKTRMLKVLNANSYEDIAGDINEISSFILNNSNKGGLSKLKVLPSLLKLASYLPKNIRRRGECQQVVQEDVDLFKLPVLKCWPHDGGKFITLPIVITKHPDTGVRNAGMYRMQILDKKSTGMHWHMHKGGAAHFDAYKEKKQKMPIAVVLGGDPIYTYCSSAPLPEGIDEFLMAGFLRKKKVKMVKCITQDIYVPNDADIVIEGYIDPEEDFVVEGPFGDHTGFYSLADKYPKFNVTCITHRKNAIYPATIVGIPPMEDAEIAKATERIFLSPLKMMYPEIIDMHLPSLGVAHNLVLIQIDTKFPGQGMKVLHSLLGSGQMMFSKFLVALPAHIDLFDLKQVAKYVLENVDFEENLVTSYGPADVLDHASYKFAYGGKLLIDATTSKSNVDETKTAFEFKKKLEFVLETKQIENSGWIFIDKQKMEKENILLEIIAENLSSNNLPRVIVVTDSLYMTDDAYFLAWLAFNNTDPKKDILIHNNTILIDASIKNESINGFTRDWPNILAMDQKVIDEIDKKWDSLGLGEFKESPSVRTMGMQSGEGAVFEIKN